MINVLNGIRKYDSCWLKRLTKLPCCYIVIVISLCGMPPCWQMFPSFLLLISHQYLLTHSLEGSNQLNPIQLKKKRRKWNPSSFSPLTWLSLSSPAIFSLLRSRFLASENHQRLFSSVLLHSITCCYVFVGVALLTLTDSLLFSYPHPMSRRRSGGYQSINHWYLIVDW